MNNGQYWIYQGVITEQFNWLNHGWTVELLEEHATRVKIKQPKPTHHIISVDDLKRVSNWFTHAANNTSVDLETDDYKLNSLFLDLLYGV